MVALKKPDNRFAAADVGKDIVIMRLDNGKFYSLSGTGVAIWRLIDGNADRKTLISAAARAFDATEDDVSADVEELLTQLKEAKLLSEG